MLTSGHPDKAYLGTEERDFQKRNYNHVSSFKNKPKMNKTTLAKHVWELKQKHNNTYIKMIYRQICSIVSQYLKKLHVMPTRKV